MYVCIYSHQFQARVNILTGLPLLGARKNFHWGQNTVSTAQRAGWTCIIHMLKEIAIFCL
jgi:hypothetical protein